MKRLEWKDEYLLGIAAVDLQHERITACFIAMAAEAPVASGSRVDSAIAPLLELLQQHFALEESMMRNFGYPGLERHMEEHRLFHAELSGLALASPSTDGGVPQQMIEVFQKWQQEHILASDRHYLEYFAGPTRKRVG